MNIRFLLATVALTIAAPVVVALSPSVYTSAFADVPENAWFFTYVQQAVFAGIVSGYNDRFGNPTGLFGPQNPVTVAEALKISLESAGFDKSMGSGYGHWAAPYLSIALGERFQLTPDQNINLDRPATRAEVASLFADAFRAPLAPYVQFYSDVSPHTPYTGSITALSRDGVVSGDTDVNGNATGQFRPSDRINRAEGRKHR